MSTINSKPYLVQLDDGSHTPINSRPYLVEGIGGGTSDYNDLNNKPTINGVTLEGDKTAADLELQPSIPIIDITPSMVIQQNPIKIQLNDEQNAIMADESLPFVVFDATAIGIGETLFVKSKTSVAHIWEMIQVTGDFEITEHTLNQISVQAVVYDDQSKIGVYNVNYLVKRGDIVDNLTTSTENKVLSANMGKTLNETKQDAYSEVLQTTNKNIVPAINEVNSVAKGANQAIGFENYVALIDDLNSASADDYRVGQNFYVQTINVPDMWIMAVSPTSSTYTYTTDQDFIDATMETGGCQVGYYFVAQLETQKVDLTNFVKNTDYASSSTGGAIKTGNSLNVTAAGVPFVGVRTYTQYQSDNTNTFIGKGTLENVLTGKALNTNIVTSTSSGTLVLENSQEARLGTLSTLILTMPATIGDIYESNLNFASGSTATTLTYSATPIIWTGDDCDAEGDFTPSANTSYEISIKKLGTDIVARVGAY